MIDGTVFPIPTEETVPQEIEPGHWRIVQSLGLSAVTGSGYLAVLHFHVIGAIGESSDIDFSDGLLSDMSTASIPATWIGDHVEVGCIPGDANGDGEINVLDMTKVARIILELDAPTCGADANGDGDINILDMTYIAKIILGLVPTTLRVAYPSWIETMDQNL